MEQTFGSYMLNGMAPGFFSAMYLCAFLGMLTFFGIEVWDAIKKDPTTPNTFSWKWLFIKGGLRLFLCLIIMFFGVTHFSEYMKFVLTLGIPNMPSDFEPVINGFSAFLLVGVFADTIAKKLAGFGKEGIKLITK